MHIKADSCWYCCVRQLAQLEAQKAQLEQYNATIQTEKDNLQLENTSLVERLEAVVKEKLPSHQFDQETPVDKTLNLLQMLIMVLALPDLIASMPDAQPSYPNLSFPCVACVLHACTSHSHLASDLQ